MDGKKINKPNLLFPQGLLFGCAVLFAVLIVALPIIGWVAFGRYGLPGLISSIAAAVVCGLAGVAALAVTARFKNTPNAVSGLFLSIMLRTFVPLLAALILSSSSSLFAKGGVFGQIVVFYLLMLPVETYVAVRMVNSNAEEPEVS